MGPTMDREIIRALFGDTIAAAEGAERGRRFPRRLADLRAQDRAATRSASTASCRSGWRTWTTPRTSTATSRTFGPSIPGSEITPYGTPELFDAARQVADLPRRRRHRLEDGLEDQPLGALPRWRPRLQDSAEPDHARVRRQPGARIPARPGVFRTCSTRIRPSRSMATSAPPRGSPKCCCKARILMRTPTSLSPVQSGEAGFLHLLPALALCVPQRQGNRAAGARRLRSRPGVEERRIGGRHDRGPPIQAAQSALSRQGNRDRR